MIKKILLAILLAFIFSSIIDAQISSYLTAKEEREKFTELNNSYPNITKISVIGKTAKGNEIYVFEIGSGENELKPALLILGGVESDDLTSPLVTLYFAQKILEQKSDERFSKLINYNTLYIIPRLSIDALEGFNQSIQREYHGSLKKDDSDRDNLYDEDDYDDLNKDGLITMMRVLNPEGKWIEDRENPGLMIMADSKKGESGKYDLFFEGFDNDKDGEINEDPVGGITLNKNATNNFVPYTWDGGSHPFEAEELRALGNFVFDHMNIHSIFSFTYENNLLDKWKIRFPKKANSKNLFSLDSAAYVMGAELLSDFVDFKSEEAAGGDIPSWAYYDAGKFSFTAPAWTFPEIKDSIKKDKSDKTKFNRNVNAFRWLSRNNPASYQNWSEFLHPDYPKEKIEIGGFLPFSKNNAPLDSIVSVQEKYFWMLLKLYSMLPELKIGRPNIEKIGNELFRVTLQIYNEGVLPTHSVAGRSLKVHRSIMIKGELSKNQKFAAGREVTLINEPISGGSGIIHSFLIMGTGKVKFDIGSPSAGFRKIEIEL